MDKVKKYIFLLFSILCVTFLLPSCYDDDRTIKIKGSDTEVNLAVNLAEQFDKIHHDFSISISGGGSGLGITSLMNGQADIANSSRPLTEEEKRMFRDKNVELKTIVFAEDATAFVVNESNPLDEIDLKTLGDLMSGEISDWEIISGLEMPVNIYGRQSSSGTYSFIKKKLGIEYSQKAKEMTGNAQILEGIKIDKSGIGYVGAGYISKKIDENKGVKVLKIKKNQDAIALSPLDAESIKNRAYFFQRPLYQFVPVKSWEKVKPFIEYETQGDGRMIIENSGYYLID